MKKLVSLVAALSFCAGISAQTVDISWAKEQVDGHRTGVVASNASNVEESMGYVKGKVYYAPNGKSSAGVSLVTWRNSCLMPSLRWRRSSK